MCLVLRPSVFASTTSVMQTNPQNLGDDGLLGHHLHIVVLQPNLILGQKRADTVSYTAWSETTHAQAEETNGNMLPRSYALSWSRLSSVARGCCTDNDYAARHVTLKIDVDDDTGDAYNDDNSDDDENDTCIILQQPPINASSERHNRYVHCTCCGHEIQDWVGMLLLRHLYSSHRDEFPDVTRQSVQIVRKIGYPRLFFVFIHLQ